MATDLIADQETKKKKKKRKGKERNELRDWQKESKEKI